MPDHSDGRRDAMPTHRHGARSLLLLALLLIASAAHAEPDTYRLSFDLELQRGKSRAKGAIELAQTEPLLLEARFRAPPDRYKAFHGDGKIARDGDYVTWTPPAEGGRIEYTVELESKRASGKLDGTVQPDWALFRADDAFPPARARMRAGSSSHSRLRLTLPDDWSIITPFVEGPAGDFMIENPERAFDRPTGWLIAGKLGRRKDTIEGMDVSVAAPVGAGVERLAMLALLRWTLPEIARELGPLPPRLSIVSAGEPMWRGGLSASNSIYIHADRPLLSENATSTLLHEALHVLLPMRAVRSQDWIDEGLAEYLALKILRDSGTISTARFEAAIAGFEERGRAVGDALETKHATGAVRARAVVIFARFDAELATLSDDRLDLFDVLREILENGSTRLDHEQLRAAAIALTGSDDIDSVPVHLTPAQSPDYDLTK
jgi:hypothetical protein